MFKNRKVFAASVGSMGIIGLLTAILLLPVKLILRDKFSMHSAMAGVGTLSGFTLLVAGLSKNQAQIDALEVMVDAM